MKIYNKTSILLVICSFVFTAYAQQRVNDQRTNETKIADIAMQLPAKDTETLNRLMQELIQLDNVIPNIASKLLPPGQGDDSQLRAAINGLAFYASQDNNQAEKKKIAEELCKAIQEVESDEIKDFLLIQLQYVAGNESLETASQYLGNMRLADAAARVLIQIGNDDAEKTLLKALDNANDAKLRKAMLYGLAQIAAPSSEKILADAAQKVNYQYEASDALGSYVLFLKNSLPTQIDMVAKSAQKMLKATSEISQIAAKSAALELLTLSAGEKAISNITGALKSDNKQYRQAALKYSENIKSAKMFDELMKIAQKEKRAEVKAEIIAAFGERGDKASWSFVKECLADNNDNVRLAARKALPSVVTGKDVPHIARLLDSASNKDELTALQSAFFAAISGQSQDKQTGIVVEQAMNSSNPGIYSNILAMIGGQKALDLVMNEGFNSKNTNLKEAAFEALINWSDDLAIPQLYKIAAGEPSGTYFDKALTTYVSKTGASKNTPEQKLIMLRNALDIAKTSGQKKAILQQIARTDTFLGWIIAGKYMDDSNNIALSHPEYHDFVSIFNGKDLTGWKGLVENPIARSKMTPAQLAQKQKTADEIMHRDWKVIDGLLVYEGKGYENICSEKMYGDFELYIDWRICRKGDSGLYLRGSPQVQIWDTDLPDASVGSGGLYNNQKNPSKPLVVADNPAEEWNSFYIRMEGDKVTVYLNGKLVTDHTILENYWNRSLPIFENGEIELQAHTNRVEFRDIYVREIPRPEPYQVSDAEKKEGFVPLFNGVNMTGWVGNLNDYHAQNGMIICDPAKGGHGNLYTEKEYADFIMRFEFQLTPAANNGLGIRTPLEGDAAYVGMELQILDDDAEVYKDLHDYQYHGSVYGVIPAKRGHHKPMGEWNYQEVIAKGNQITITLNGTVIVDGDIAEASKNFTSTMDGNKHPGLSNKRGHLGFLGHGSWVAFKNLRIKEL